MPGHETHDQYLRLRYHSSATGGKYPAAIVPLSCADVQRGSRPTVDTHDYFYCSHRLRRLVGVRSRYSALRFIARENLHDVRLSTQRNLRRKLSAMRESEFVRIRIIFGAAKIVEPATRTTCFSAATRTEWE